MSLHAILDLFQTELVSCKHLHSECWCRTSSPFSPPVDDWNSRCGTFNTHCMDYHKYIWSPNKYFHCTCFKEYQLECLGALTYVAVGPFQSNLNASHSIVILRMSIKISLLRMSKLCGFWVVWLHEVNQTCSVFWVEGIIFFMLCWTEVKARAAALQICDVLDVWADKQKDKHWLGII